MSTSTSFIPVTLHLSSDCFILLHSVNWTRCSNLLAGYLQDGRSGITVMAFWSSRHQSIKRPIFFAHSLSNLLLKPFIVFGIFLYYHPAYCILRQHDEREKKLSNVFIATIFNQFQRMSPSPSRCI